MPNIFRNGVLFNDPDMTPPEIDLAAVASSVVQRHLDAAAVAKGYDSIFTAVTYVDDANPVFAAEGAAFKAWRSAVWTSCATILADVTAGTRAAPTFDELLAELPPAP